MSFQLEGGTILGIVGPNGSGKTTLLRIAAGLERADQGDVLVEGFRSGQEHGPRLGYIPCSVRFPPFLEVYDLVRYLGHLAGCPHDPLTEAVRRVFASINLDSVGTQEVGTLSAGFLQRVNIAQALVQNPNVIFADEPMLNLDSDSRNAIERAFLESAASGVAIALVSHHLASIERLCDFVLFLRDGRTVTYDGQRPSDGR